MGIYRSPTSAKVPKSTWTLELESIMEAITALPGNCLLAGDFNSDLQEPDKAPQDGRILLDLLDV